MSKYSVFNTETNKGNIGLYFENNEKKLLGGATSQKSQKKVQNVTLTSHQNQKLHIWIHL